MRIRLVAVGALIGFAGAPASVLAAPSCSVEALNALHVPDVSVTDAKPVVAAGTAPAYCDVQGTVVTKGAGVAEGLARFAMQLPEAWQQRFLFLGVGGNAGNLVPSANVTDRSSALGKGYATILTDTGHVGDGVTAKWTRLPDGRPDTVKRTDFSYRAAHNVTVAGKAFAEAYYAAKVEHAYFDGCSTGGRMAMMEAGRYPEDYEGVIAGDPLMSSITSAARAVVQNAALSSAAAYIPEATIAAIDARVTGRCDAIDGAKDGLVQNPSSCPVHAEDLLCRAGETEACLNADQVRVLKSYTSPFRDTRGHVLFGPWAITDLSGAQGFAFNVTGLTAPDLSDRASPWKDPKAAPRSWVIVKEMLTYWLGLGPSATVADLDIDPDTNTVGDKMLAMMDASLCRGQHARSGEAEAVHRAGAQDDPLSRRERSLDPGVAIHRVLPGACGAATGHRAHAGERAVVPRAGNAPLQRWTRPGPVRHAVRHRGMGRARQGSGCDPGEHQAGKPCAAPPAAVPLPAAGALSRDGRDHRSLELGLRDGDGRVAGDPAETALSVFSLAAVRVR